MTIGVITTNLLLLISPSHPTNILSYIYCQPLALVFQNWLFFSVFLFMKGAIYFGLWIPKTSVLFAVRVTRQNMQDDYNKAVCKQFSRFWCAF